MLRSHHSLEPFKQATICILNLISTYKMSLSLSGPPYSMQCIHLTYFTMYIRQCKIGILAPKKITTRSHCLKITLNVAIECWHFPLIFVLLKVICLVTLFDCSFIFSKTRQNGQFLIYLCPFKCKDSSLRSLCCMRLFL